MNFPRISYLVLSLTIIIFTTSIIAQSDTTTQNTSLKKGSWSLQFRYNNKLGFESFKGGNISAKYHFTDKSALRFGVNLNSQNNSINAAFDTGSDKYQYLEDRDLNMINISIITDYVYYISTKNKFNLFLSGGTIFGVGYSKENRSNGSSIIDSTYNISDNKANSWSAGINLSFGVEWFVNHNFSIHGEYQTQLLYQYVHHTYTSSFPKRNLDSVLTGNSIQKSFSLSPANVLIGVSLYF